MLKFSQPYLKFSNNVALYLVPYTVFGSMERLEEGKK
ncbi:hypothetical protein A2U01_0097188, partial [Trifolium medium]|nr:hypothetical protein [Trifolium medium]